MIRMIRSTFIENRLWIYTIAYATVLLDEEPKIIIETEVKLHEFEIWSLQISSFQRNSSS